MRKGPRANGLRDLRAGKAVTQAELAGRLGKSQGNVSEMEQRDDVHVSSLREYVEALGGELQISAVFDEDQHSIELS